MCGKYNDGLGLDFGGDNLAYVLQFPINGMMSVIHDIGLVSTGQRSICQGARTVNSTGKDGY